MSLVFDKHRLISGLSLPATTLRQPRAIGRRHKADTVLTIGLVNNMPDSAMLATERQFKGLLKAAAGSNIVDLRYFSLPAVRRSALARSRIDRHYTAIGELDHLRLDGLIVTGAEPAAPCLAQEPYWRELTELIDWAEANTRSTIWSCLAAHGAVLHLDGIERKPLIEKCSGVFDCTKLTDDWLTQGLSSPLEVSHSRANELKAGDLTMGGYKVLTQSRMAGVDIFAKSLRSYFVFFQGHPEYDAMALKREYRRDVGRFLSGAHESYPKTPFGYFDPETEKSLSLFERRARANRKPELISELPQMALRPAAMREAAAKLIFANWIQYVAGC